MTLEPQGRDLFALLERFVGGELSEEVWAGAGSLALVIQGQMGRRERAALERELTATRRDELAALLRHACYRTLHERPREHTLLAATRLSDGRIWTERPKEWIERARELEADPVSRRTDVAGLIRRAREGGFCGDPSASVLATAALRVVDEWKARVYLVLALAQEGALDRSLRAAEEALVRARTPEARSHSLLALAGTQARVGVLHHAMERYRDASALEVLPAVPQFGWFTVAVRLGLPIEALEAGHRLADVCTSAAGIDDCIQAWRAARGKGVSGPWKEPAEEIRKIDDRLPSVAHEVLEVAFER